MLVHVHRELFILSCMQNTRQGLGRVPSCIRRSMLPATATLRKGFEHCMLLSQLKATMGMLALNSAPSPCLMPAGEAPTSSAAAQLAMHQVQRKLSAVASAGEMFCRGCHAGVACASLQTMDGIA